MKKIITLLLSFFIITACAGANKNGPDASHGLNAAILGAAHLILSPLQIAAGLTEGLSSIPYYLSTNIHEVNRGLIKAQAKITLDDTYESAYGKQLNSVPENGDTGDVFRRMKHATQYFQAVLKQYGVHEYNHYFLTSIDTANDDGYTLFAVVYRPLDTIQIIDKYNGKDIREFSKTDRLYYEPFEKTSDGRKLDIIIDWAGIPREYVKTQKAQAIMITMAANAVLDKKISSTYWEIENRWMAGEYKKIVEKRMGQVKNSMKI